MHKIKTIESLAEILKAEKAKGKKIVHCHGVFDLLHIGHIRYLEQASRMGDILVVTLTPDQFVDKGPHRPAFTKNLRAEAIASLSCVNYVAINLWSTAEETIRLLKPDFYVKGSEFKNLSSDMTGKIAKEEKIAQEVGTKMAFIDDIVFSSTNLINRYFSKFPDDVQNYLNVFRSRYTIDDIMEIIDKMAELKVIVIGDTIIDEYVYCNAIGKSSKDPTLALKYQSHDKFAGGVLAVANHVANFARHVQLKTVIGDQDSHETFIRSQLEPNVSFSFEIQNNAPTLIKRRFIDSYSLNKLLEIYVMDDSGLSMNQDEKICLWLRKNIKDYDIVIASDFGHGAISKNMINILCDQAKFLAVNTQANAGNRGFNTISKYHRANFLCIAEHELRLETRDLKTELRPLMLSQLRKKHYSKLVVTIGSRGCAVCEPYIQIPSFVENVIDRVGAGDAFFAITSLAACLGTSSELIAFIGNIVGALAVKVLGNKKSIDLLTTKKFIVSLLK
ncbi:cytidyltransferase [Candidatus Magnetomorum sp. HK-1]|nr:cytidyltransferase [Candidatus Magnetomorum sp. HK-1]